MSSWVPWKAKKSKEIPQLFKRMRRWSKGSKGKNYMTWNQKKESNWNNPSQENDPIVLFIALFDYDPNAMSPNKDNEEELPFKEGQLIRVRFFISQCFFIFCKDD